MLLLLFVVKTSCRGDDPCDLINSEEVGGSGEQNDTIIAFITVSGRNLGGREGEDQYTVDNQTINFPIQYTQILTTPVYIHPTSPHTLTNLHTLAILSPAGTFSRTDVVYDGRPNTGILSFTSRTVTSSSTVDVAGGTPSNQ